MTSRRAVGVTLAAAAAGLVVAGGAAAAAHPLITQAQTGKTFLLPKGGAATLRLSGRWGWTEPRVSSRAIVLTPVLFFRDPGYREWAVSARAPGTATIRSTGKPGCTGCGLAARTLRVTIVVG